VKRDDETDEIDLVQLGLARFLPDRSSSIMGTFIDEPAAVMATLGFFKKNKSFDDWLTTRWNASTETQGFVFEDIIIHQIVHALSKEGGCRLDSILTFHGTPPNWASQLVKLVAPQSTSSGINTDIVTPSTLPYACSPKTWDQTAMWFWGKVAGIPVCAPDNFMGPDLLCFVELSGSRLRRRKRILLGIQISSGRKAAEDAPHTINPDNFWMQHVSLEYAIYLVLKMISPAVPAKSGAHSL
jgi:hypothetical protein